MSGPSVKHQGLKAVPCCHDHPPQYDSCQRSQDLLTSIIENEYTIRKSTQRIDELDIEIVNTLEELKKKSPLEYPDWNLTTEFYEELGRSCTEMLQIIAGLVNICKERTIHNIDLYKAISKLTDDEFKRTYDSLKRGPNQQIRHELGQDHGHCGDRDSGHSFQCSSMTKQGEIAGNCAYNACGRFAELLAKMDKINEKSGRGLPSDMTNVSKMTDDATAKSPVSFWKRIFRPLARP